MDEKTKRGGRKERNVAGVHKRGEKERQGGKDKDSIEDAWIKM